MASVDFLVAYTERTQDGREQRRTAMLPSASDPIAAYREATARWLSGSAAGHRYNLQVEPIRPAAELERV